MHSDDRREFQRLKLAKPILATMDGQSALILDIGIAGAFLEHFGEVNPGDEFVLSFRWQGDDVTFRCRVARSQVIRNPAGDGASTVAHTGVRFMEPEGDSQRRLQDLMATFVGRVLAAQRANASGDISDASGAVILDQMGGAHRSRSRGFLLFRLRDDVWWKTTSDSPDQPAGEGFTVASFEDEEDLEDLCRAYERADEEGRHLIRLIAELSTLSARRV
jgi:hypothetical protein